MSSSHIMCLSRILFIFPSQYLFTIGFKTLFCFRLEVQSSIVNSYYNSRHKFRALYITGLSFSIRISLTTKDFSKTIINNILQECIKQIKQHVERTQHFNWWTYIISFAITQTFNFFFFTPLTYMLKFSGNAKCYSCTKLSTVVNH